MRDQHNETFECMHTFVAVYDDLFSLRRSEKQQLCKDTKYNFIRYIDSLR